MDWNLIIYIGISALSLLIVGAVLLWIWGRIRFKLDCRRMKIIEKALIPKGKRAMVEALCESMDILPEKINEVKRTIDEGG